MDDVLTSAGSIIVDEVTWFLVVLNQTEGERPTMMNLVEKGSVLLREMGVIRFCQGRYLITQDLVLAKLNQTKTNVIRPTVIGLRCNP